MTAPTTTETARPKFDGITDEKSAAWFLRKIRILREERAAIKAAVEARDAELEADENRLMSLYGQQLEAWARTESEARRRRTVTVVTAGMQLCLRVVPSRLTIENRDDAITTARAVCPDSVTTESVTNFDTAAFLAHAQSVLESGGELLPGVTLTESKESFSVKPVKKGESA